MNATLGVGMLGYAFTLRQALQAKDVVRAYDLVYQALGGE
jgi:hypothetical protein